eukprot:CAMPEP_0170486834 /NCGR_PEP_ID=MMETSP0208-20121228/5760_1 /TAXON_ID=197538 /ORGANISM="Strombidium inclinatum, Strain S3" /LENGTH=109 /DNA_ID=CAMNT_0010760901 /DNA_START=1328 /DNA_END=1656 /DNA_ORIENTATION=-
MALDQVPGGLVKYDIMDVTRREPSIRVSLSLVLQALIDHLGGGVRKSGIHLRLLTAVRITAAGVTAGSDAGFGAGAATGAASAAASAATGPGVATASYVSAATTKALPS